MSGIGKAAAEEAAWAKLQRSAVWWLGEHANAAALEYAGDNEAVKATAAINAAMQRTTSPGEIIAMQVQENSDITKRQWQYQETLSAQRGSESTCLWRSLLCRLAPSSSEGLCHVSVRCHMTIM